MADRSAAAAFGIFFKELAANGSEDCKEVAHRAWQVRVQFDFRDEQMGCDGSLVKLGLATVDEKTRVVTYFGRG